MISGSYWDIILLIRKVMHILNLSVSIQKSSHAKKKNTEKKESFRNFYTNVNKSLDLM